MTRATPPESIDGSFVPLRRHSVRSVDLECEGVVYDEATQRWQLLNDTAFVIWKCLDGTGPIDEIARDLSEVSGADEAVVRRDVTNTIRLLGQYGLLEGVEPAPLPRPRPDPGERRELDADGRGEEPRVLPVPGSS